MLNFQICKPPKILENCTDTRWTNNTIYNHFENPLDFMDAMIDSKDHSSHTSTTRAYIEKGIDEFSRIDKLDLSYDKLYNDVAKKVKDKLLARGFTTAMLYGNVEFTTQKTGVMSKQRALLGKKDCYFKNPTMDDGKLFHDIYINLSYSWSIPDSTIVKNSYAVYALTKELARLIPIRVIVVNHVGTNTPTCYSYVLKKFGVPLNPKQFLFFTSSSKRTFGWATYELLNNGANRNSTIGEPTNTVSIADFNLDKEIETIFSKIQQISPQIFK